jgi:hypothetical protein
VGFLRFIRQIATLIVSAREGNFLR